MYRIIISFSTILLILSLYFLSTLEETWQVNNYKENNYKDDKGNSQNEVVPVVVQVSDSKHDLGYGLLIIGSCLFLSGVYMYSFKYLRKENS